MFPHLNLVVWRPPRQIKIGIIYIVCQRKGVNASCVLTCLTDDCRGPLRTKSVTQSKRGCWRRCLEALGNGAQGIALQSACVLKTAIRQPAVADDVKRIHSRCFTVNRPHDNHHLIRSSPVGIQNRPQFFWCHDHDTHRQPRLLFTAYAASACACSILIS